MREPGPDSLASTGQQRLSSEPPPSTRVQLELAPFAAYQAQQKAGGRICGRSRWHTTSPMAPPKRQPRSLPSSVMQKQTPSSQGEPQPDSKRRQGG